LKTAFPGTTVALRAGRKNAFNVSVGDGGDDDDDDDDDDGELCWNGLKLGPPRTLKWSDGDYAPIVDSVKKAIDRRQ